MHIRDPEKVELDAMLDGLTRTPTSRARVQAEIDRQVNEYLRNGGRIDSCRYRLHLQQLHLEHANHPEKPAHPGDIQKTGQKAEITLMVFLHPAVIKFHAIRQVEILTGRRARFLGRVVMLVKE